MSDAVAEGEKDAVGLMAYDDSVRAAGETGHGGFADPWRRRDIGYKHLRLHAVEVEDANALR